VATRWIDLLDPTSEEVQAVLPAGVDPDVLNVLLALPAAERTRPLLEGHGAYVFGVFLDAVPVPDEDRVVYRELDVVATTSLVVTVRKTPNGGRPWDPTPLETPAARGASAGELLFRLIDDVAESFLDVIDAADLEIDELEEHIDVWPSDRIRRRLGSLRHDLLHARRTVSATRGAVRRIIDKRLDIGNDTLFPDEVERMFTDTYETLFRAAEDIDVARDLLTSVRDHHQAQITEAQNEVVKKLTVIASLVLVPTLIVGFYGQNFQPAFDDAFWTLGLSTGLIIGTTMIQLALYRWRRWI
jgi:Mg2+ and Co2+ transporter CorA